MTRAVHANRGRLILVCGLPGSGKTSLARRLERETPALRFCADEWMADLGIDLYDTSARERIEQLQWEVAERVIELGGTAIIEWGTWARSERDALRERARELGAAVELRCLDASLETLWGRVRERDMRRRLGRRTFTLSDMKDAEARFQRPDAEELALFDSPAAGVE